MDQKTFSWVDKRLRQATVTQWAYLWERINAKAAEVFRGWIKYLMFSLTHHSSTYLLQAPHSLSSHWVLVPSLSESLHERNQSHSPPPPPQVQKLDQPLTAQVQKLDQPPHAYTHTHTHTHKGRTPGAHW